MWKPDKINLRGTTILMLHMRRTSLVVEDGHIVRDDRAIWIL